MRDLKIELKVFVDFLFCNLMAGLPYNVSDNVEIIIVKTWLRGLMCSGNGRIKKL